MDEFKNTKYEEAWAFHKFTFKLLAVLALLKLIYDAAGG